MERVTGSAHRSKIRDYIRVNNKSYTAAIIYASVFGPLGCIYTRPTTAIVALFLAIAIGLIYWPLIGLVWASCVIMAPFQVRAYNRKLRRTARYFVV